jgi:hypothetical protein
MSSWLDAWRGYLQVVSRAGFDTVWGSSVANIPIELLLIKHLVVFLLNEEDQLLVKTPINDALKSVETKFNGSATKIS